MASDWIWDAQKLPRIAQTLVEQGYSVSDGFLLPRGRELMDFRVSELFAQGEMNSARVGPSGQSLELVQERSDKSYWLDPAKSAVDASVNDALLEMLELLKTDLRISLNRFEAHYAVYAEGAFYKKHLDRFQNDKESPKGGRELSFIFYLHSEWNEGMGGELLLYSPNAPEGAPMAKIQPRPGTLVVFRSTLFPHEVLPSKFERKSLTGWFRSDV